MELDLANTPGFFTAAIGGSENIFDHSFAAHDSFIGNDTSADWDYSALDQMSYQDAAASHYPSPPPATIAFPDQQLSNTIEHFNVHTASKRQYPHWQPAALPRISTDFDLGTVKFEHGQFTPPSKSVSPTPGAPDSIAAGPQHPPQAAGRNQEQDAQGAAQVPKRRTRRSRKRNPPSAEAQQEKREKLLERNRVAASKCRQKRKSWTSTLEEQARELQQRKEALSTLANSLKDEVLFLKGQMLRHTDCSCTRVREYLNNEADSLACARHPTFASNATRSNGSRLASSLSSAPKSTEHGSLLFLDPTSPPYKEESPDAMDELLKESIMQDTSHEGIARRTRS